MMSKLQEKSPALQREHLALENLKFLFFLSFLGVALAYTVTRPCAGFCHPEPVAQGKTVREGEHFVPPPCGILHSSMPEDISGDLPVKKEKV
jgi:hypothetical protein